MTRSHLAFLKTITGHLGLKLAYLAFLIYNYTKRLTINLKWQTRPVLPLSNTQEREPKNCIPHNGKMAPVTWLLQKCSAHVTTPKFA